ncbi:hypothetical protein [Cupriavidus sp. RAF20_2]|uniref:hypothetical protein n=1 Tax=Cupriavidus sp. RAF20_2 TaxID=3233053 RepID=UPI003F92D18B
MKLIDDVRVILGCLVGGLVAGLAIATAWTFKPEKDFWDVMTAVGTVAAACAAVGIALWQDRRTGHERMERARLRASALTMRVSMARAEVNAAASYLEEANKFDCAPETFKDTANKLRSLPSWEWTDIEPLVPLPNSCAHNLAAGLDRIQISLTLLESFASSSKTAIGDERKRTAGMASFVLTEAGNLIGFAVTELQRASFSRLPRTTRDD